MKEVSLQRLLIPSMLIQYTDFLYYDAVLKSTMGLEGLRSQSFKNSEKLTDANLLIKVNTLFSEKELEQAEQIFFSEMTSLFTTKSFHKNFRNRISYLADVAYREYTNFVLAKGINAIPRYSSKDFNCTFKTGKYQLLSTIYSQLPALDWGDINIDDLIDFLKDEETQIKKQRMFSWQNDIETKIEKGDIKIEHIPDMIAERLDTYIEHLKLSELKFKYGVFENVLMIGANIISGLTLVGLPNAVKNMIQFKKRELELKQSEIKAPGRELAYIVRVHRRFSK